MKKPVFIILGVFLLWRILLFLPLFVGYQTLSYRLGYHYTRLEYYNYTFNKSIVNNFLISPWANFDGVAYLGIASYGYSGGNARFFPLFPLLISAVTFLLGGAQPFELKQFLIAFTLSNLFFLASCFIFYKLLRLDYTKKQSLLCLLFLILFPTSFFFVSIYTESLFLFLTLLCFYFARKKLWLLAGVSGFLLCLTRIVGGVMFIVLLYDFFLEENVWQHIKEKKKRFKTLVKSLPLFIIPFGVVSFIVYNAIKFRNAFYFIIAQGQVQNNRSTSFVFFVQTLFRYIKIFLTVSPHQFEWWISLLEFVSFFFVCAMIWVAIKAKIRISYILFTVLGFLIPISSGTFSGLPRYIIILFPLFIAMARVQNKLWKFTYVLISIILLFLLTMFFARGYYIA